MNPERFGDNPSGRLIQSSQGEATYWAFAPDPLPPLLTFDPALICSLSDADRALGELAGLGRALPNPHLLINPFVRREAVLSSRIEGTQADLKDLYAYEAGQLALSSVKPAPPETDVREVHNYVVALEYGLERLKTQPLNLSLIREVHGKLLEGVRGERATPGEFRRTQNWIGRPGCTLVDADFVPPPAGEMNAALDALEKYLNSGNKYPPLLRLALIHYQFETIHPFLDGNGRVGRLLMALLLVHWDLLPLPLLYLSAFFEEHRQEYYDLLMGVSARSAWQEWAQFFLHGIAEQARDAVVRARRLQDLQLKWRERLAQVRASALPMRLADRLFQTPFLTIPQAQRLLAVTYRSAQLNVQKLVDAGILRPLSENAYGKSFFAPEILAAIGENAPV